MDIQRVAQFEKVPDRQFIKDWLDAMAGSIDDIPASEVLDSISALYDKIKLPVRATVGSAGYDLFSPIDIELEPGGEAFFPTGICCKIDPGWFLMIVPRSGMGTKYKLRLANTAGIIDSDYYYADNHGEIKAKICNEGDKTLHIDAGKAFCQAILVPYGITYDDQVGTVRHGGFGSTDKR